MKSCPHCNAPALARDWGSIRRLRDTTIALRLLGGPPIGDGQWTNWESEESYGYIVASLDDPQLHDPEAFRETVRDCRIDNVVGLRALLRLVASDAAAKALAHVLGESEPGSSQPVDEEDVLASAVVALRM